MSRRFMAHYTDSGDIPPSIGSLVPILARQHLALLRFLSVRPIARCSLVLREPCKVQSETTLAVPADSCPWSETVSATIPG